MASRSPIWGILSRRAVRSGLAIALSRGPNADEWGSWCCFQGAVNAGLGSARPYFV